MDLTVAVVFGWVVLDRQPDQPGHLGHQCRGHPERGEIRLGQQGAVLLVVGPARVLEEVELPEISHNTDEFTPADTGPDDPAVIIYTSGTTGNPKGALHGHRVLLGHLPRAGAKGRGSGDAVRSTWPAAQHPWRRWPAPRCGASATAATPRADRSRAHCRSSARG